MNHANGEGYAALDAACRAGSVEAVRLLVEAGADVNHCDGNGDAALSAAAMDAHVDVMRVLLGARAEVTQREMPSVLLPHELHNSNSIVSLLY